MNTLLIRICKTALVFAMAVYFSLIAFNNLTDYNTNYVFIKHVLSMDTVFPTTHTTWHAIHSPIIYQLVYAIIILWEIITAFICWFATIMLFISRQNDEKFQHYKIFAFFGLALGFFLYLFAFVTIGGEWFQMWQSPHWNVKNQAELSLAMIGIIMLILIAPNDK